MDANVIKKLQMLRQRSGLSIRELAKLSGVTAGMISCMERNKTSPSLTTLQKILSALDTNLAEFFSPKKETDDSPFMFRESMTSVNDGSRNYTIIFQKTNNIQIEMFDEYLYPSVHKTEFEELKCDIAGYIISGEMVIEFKNPKKAQHLRPGDAFYIKMNTEHRGIVKGDQPVRLITMYHPARY
jgi:transcriptional regulator with XRE-family HTH domain